MTIINANININTAAKAATTIETPKTEPKDTTWAEPIGWEVIPCRDKNVRSRKFQIKDLSWEEFSVNPETGMMSEPHRVGQGGGTFEKNLDSDKEDLIDQIIYSASIYGSTPKVFLGDCVWRCIEYLKREDQNDPRVAKIRERWNSFVEEANRRIAIAAEVRREMQKMADRIKELEEANWKLQCEKSDIELEKARMEDELDQLRNDASAHADDIASPMF